MKSKLAERQALLNKARIFQLLKYTIYILLMVDAYQYFLSDYAASRHLFETGFSFSEFAKAFAITIDVTAWLVLLLFFELETAVIPAEKMKGPLLWFLHGVRLVCYFFVFSSYYGYFSKYWMFVNAVPFAVDDVCALVGGAYTYVVDLDEYLPITEGVCQKLNQAPLMRLEGTHILADPERLQEARFMALVDVLYATVWLIVIAILEIDVYLKEHGKLKGWVLLASEVTKALLYLALLGGAVFWGIKGEFLDFWDAFLWLAAFALIDLNVFGLADDS
ncbi:MAG: hypothetical protein AXA67_06995 [Methylothermaceae bacteria B42]|nr:MAG: hypothetical protein AXA67_06995 [Methylothermaceae bacteria B42]HHJ40228.1 hypothetical protein [Methylothermaceae bacterium]